MSPALAAQLIAAPLSISDETLYVALNDVLEASSGRVNRLVLGAELRNVTLTPFEDKTKFQGPIPVRATRTVIVLGPLHSVDEPVSVTIEVGCGLIVIVCALAISAELPAQVVLAPRSVRAESLKVASEAVLTFVAMSVTGNVIVETAVVLEKTLTPFDDHVKLQGPMPVKTACTVFVSPLQTADEPNSVTPEVGRGLMVIVWELARSAALAAQSLTAP